jgi:broad specificity phosphatase PhoE
MTTPPTDDFVRELEEDQSDPFLSPRNGGTEVYLIRHADAMPGADEVVEGGYDAQALSTLGRRQAQALAERLKSSGVAAIYSSPIARAIQTAQPTADALGLEVRIEHDLREIELGPIGPEVLGTATPQELSEALRKRMREIAFLAMSTGRWEHIPGSEPVAALKARATAVVAHIAADHPGQRIAAVSHGGTINAYFAALLGTERDYFFPAANTSISVVRIKGPRRLLLALNDIAHLQQAGLTMPGA